jgi:NAD(P) transhydrogenase subunit beta
VYTVIALAYLVSACLFILGLKRLQSPVTARQGNQMAALGMLVAVVATLFLYEILTPVEMIVATVIGGGIGAVLARRVEMTSMPELVAVFNGFGGLASALVASAEVARYFSETPAAAEAVAGGAPPLAPLTLTLAVTVAASVLIGTVTFSGSFVAFAKLKGLISGQPAQFLGMRALTVLLLLGVAAAVGLILYGAHVFTQDSAFLMGGLLGLGGLALILGIFLVIPIGGADMPVVVALLNSYSGLAAAATGFVLDNIVLIISGTLVGVSGLMLTRIMCDAMNRSLWNVLLGGFGGADDSDGPAVEGATGGTVRETSPADTAILLTYAEQVVVIPGYGMAVAQAQHQVQELAEVLEGRGVTVKYGIHPVAGRMPGHMNVLLAEANVPYDHLYEMDDINPEFPNTDVSLVIGANDVVNPAARTKKGSPIYGMPILDADASDTVVVLKRSLRPGYSGVQNDLFYNDNTRMLFGDAKESVGELTAEVKALG